MRPDIIDVFSSLRKSYKLECEINEKINPFSPRSSAVKIRETDEMDSFYI